MRKERLLSITLATIIIAGVFADLAFARPIPPSDFAKFVEDPYYRTNSVVVSYCHLSSGWMYIELYNPNNQYCWGWMIQSGDDDVVIQSVTLVNGTWRLKYWWLYYGPFYDTATMWHTFGIADPSPSQANFASDWSRQPNNPSIYDKATSIIGTPTSSYNAAIAIHDHVIANFQHIDQDPYFNWRADIDLLSDLNNPSIHAYRGVCRSDAVLLTSYARSLGIPARIIHLTAELDDGMHTTYENHFFAEFYVYNGSQNQWIPIDGDPVYNWTSLDEANKKISLNWPQDHIIGGVQMRWNISLQIVKFVNGAGGPPPFYDTQLDEIPYDGSLQYRNDDYSLFPP